MFLFFLFGMHIYKSLKPLKLWLQMMIVIMLTEYNKKKTTTKISFIKLLVFVLGDIFCFSPEIFHSRAFFSANCHVCLMLFK